MIKSTAAALLALASSASLAQIRLADIQSPPKLEAPRPLPLGAQFIDRRKRQVEKQCNVSDRQRRRGDQIA